MPPIPTPIEKKCLCHRREKRGTCHLAEVGCKQPLQGFNEATGEIIVDAQSDEEREHQRHHNNHGALDTCGHAGIDNAADDQITDERPDHHRLIIV